MCRAWKKRFEFNRNFSQPTFGNLAGIVQYKENQVCRYSKQKHLLCLAEENQNDFQPLCDT